MTTSNSSNITPPRVPFLDAAGLISRPWFLWLLNMFARANSSDVEIAALTDTVNYLAEAPLPVDAETLSGLVPSDIAPAAFSPAFTNSGVLAAKLVAISTHLQDVLDTETTITFDSTVAGSFGGITRTGSTFTSSIFGTFVFILSPQMYISSVGNTAKIWTNLNGTAVANSGTIYTSGSATDSTVVPHVACLTLVPGDTVNFRMIGVVYAGTSLVSTPAAAPAPVVPSIQITVLGFKS